MPRLFTALLLAAGLLVGTGAMACEKHLNGHQNGTYTNAEGFQK